MLRKTHLQLEALEDRYLLNGRPDFLVNTTLTNNQTNPAVAADGQGHFVVAWEGFNPATNSLDIFAQRFDANGTALGGELRVNTITAGSQTNAKVATDGAGGFVVVWRAPNPQNLVRQDIWGRRYDAAGQALSPADVLLNPTSQGIDSGVQVAMNAAGDQIVIT